MAGVLRTGFKALAAVLAGMLCMATAHADIYTWVDKKGITNVSNLPPPEGVSLTNVSHAPPKDPAREAAAQQAELRILNERLQQLQDQLEQARRDPPFAFGPPPPMLLVAPPAPASYIVNVISAPSYPQGSSGCDYSFGDCGFGAGVWPGYFYAPGVFPVRGGKNSRRFGPSPGGGSFVPPLIPPPQPPRGGGSPHRRY